MALDLRLRVFGEQRVAARFDMLAERSRDARPALRQILALIYEGEAKQFATQKGWPRLARSTRERDARGNNRDPRLMRATGHLQRALTVPGADSSVVDMDDLSLRFGLKGGRSKVYYGRFHQLGHGVPRRQVVVFDQRQRNRSSRILANYFTGR